MDDLVKSKQTLSATTDAFLNGKFEAMQPVGHGHRSGLDALLLAAAVPAGAKGLAADLGSGSGVAGLATAVLRPNLKVQLVENNPMMADLAAKSLRLEANHALAPQMDVLKADVTLSGQSREKAGLTRDKFEYVIMNPPYNDASQYRVSDDQMKAEAHMMGEGGLDAWVRTATAILKPRGMLVMIYRSQSIGQIIAATQGRFGGLTLMPIYSHASEPAKLLIIRATKGSRAPISIAPALVTHQENGSFTPQLEAILTGDGFLFNG